MMKGPNIPISKQTFIQQLKKKSSQKRSTSTDEQEEQQNYRQRVYSMLVNYEKNKLETEIQEAHREEEIKKQYIHQKDIQEKYTSILNKQMNSKKNTEQKRKLIYNMLTRVLKTQLKKRVSILNKLIGPKNIHNKEYLSRYYDLHYSQVSNIIFVKIYISPHEESSFSKKKILLLTKDPVLRKYIKRFLHSKSCEKLFQRMNFLKHEQTFKTFESLVKQHGLNYACNKLTFDPKRFSKIPWLQKNFEVAKKEFITDFLQDNDTYSSRF